MRRVLLTLAALAIALGLTVGPAVVDPDHHLIVPVAKAHDAGADNYIPPASCTGDVVQAFHDTPAGNHYEMKGHLCLEVGPQSGNSLAINTRWHGHCRRNGAVWDGCRVNTELVVEVLVSGVGWQDRGVTAFDIGPVPSSTSYFADSSTYVSFADYFANGLWVRAKAEDQDNVRFRLADGTSVLKDMGDLAGSGIQIVTT